MIENKVVLVYVALIFVGILGGVGDILVSRWAKTNELAWLIGSFAFWIASITLFGYFMRSERFPLSAAIFIAFVVHGTIAVLFDLVILKTRLNREECLGMALAVVAVLVLEVGRNHREEAEQTRETTVAVSVNSDEGN